MPILMNLRDGWTYGKSALWILGSCGRSDESAFGAIVPSLFNSLLLCVSCIISARLGTSIGSFVKVGLDGGSIAPSSIIDVFSSCDWTNESLTCVLPYVTDISAF